MQSGSLRDAQAIARRCHLFLPLVPGEACQDEAITRCDRDVRNDHGAEINRSSFLLMNPILGRQGGAVVSPSLTGRCRDMISSTNKHKRPRLPVYPYPYADSVAVTHSGSLHLPQPRRAFPSASCRRTRSARHGCCSPPANWLRTPDSASHRPARQERTRSQSTPTRLPQSHWHALLSARRRSASESRAETRRPKAAHRCHHRHHRRRAAW